MICFFSLLPDPGEQRHLDFSSNELLISSKKQHVFGLQRWQMDNLNKAGGANTLTLVKKDSTWKSFTYESQIWGGKKKTLTKCFLIPPLLLFQREKEDVEEPWRTFMKNISIPHQTVTYKTTKSRRSSFLMRLPSQPHIALVNQSINIGQFKESFSSMLLIAVHETSEALEQMCREEN